MWQSRLMDSSRGRIARRLKVNKAHVKPGCRSQSAFLTRGNETVDALAKSKAKQLADIRFAEFSQCLYDAVSLQTHIVSSLIARAEHATNGAFNMFDDSAHVQQPTIPVSRPCSCPPLSRCRGKVQGCRGICKDNNSFFFFSSCGSWRTVLSRLRNWTNFLFLASATSKPVLWFRKSFRYCCRADKSLSITSRLKKAGCFGKYHVRTRKPSCSISKPQNQFSAQKNGERIPWLLLFLNFCSAANAECCEWMADSSIHTNVCQFRTATK